MSADRSCTDCQQGSIRLLKNGIGVRRFCFKHALEVNGRDGSEGWRDACGDLFRAQEHERALLMCREFAR
jgi:hypothetical protein